MPFDRIGVPVARLRHCQMAIQEAASKREIFFEKLALISGIGCSSRIGGYLYCYGAHTTHGRALPFAQGVKLVNRDLEVVACSGDGDAYAIGIGHTIHAIKRNVDLTYIVFDNHVYGLTKGQTSPRSSQGFQTKTTPHGNIETPLAVSSMAIAAGAGLWRKAICSTGKVWLILLCREWNIAVFRLSMSLHPALPTINTIVMNGTKNIYPIWTKNYDPTDKGAAMKKLIETEGLVTGVIYRNEQSGSYEDAIGLPETPLVQQVERLDTDLFKTMINEFR